MKTPTKKELLKALNHIDTLAHANVACIIDFDKLTESRDVLYNFILLLPDSDESN